MQTELTTPVLALIVVCGLVAHLAFVVAARWFNPMVLVIGLFFALAPWAAALIPGAEVLKFGRLYLTVAGVGVAIMFMRVHRANLAAVMLFLFMSYYWLAGIWSEQPWGAIQFKGLSMPALLMAILAASSLRTKEELAIALRVFTIFSLLFLIPCTFELLTRGIGLARGGRFAPFGLNANRMAHESACMLIVAAGVALYDRSIQWKIIAYGVGTMAAASILASGSRAAVGQSVIAAIILGLPLFKRPILPLMLGSFAALILWLLMPSGTDAAYERFSELNFDNRSGIWGLALDTFRDNPIWGAGWVFDDTARAAGSTANLHSIYLQILAELGIAGAVLAILTTAILGWQYLGLWRYARSTGTDVRYIFLGMAFCAAPLAHGLAESSTFMPGTINLVMMGMGFALIGPLREFAAREAAEQVADPEPEDLLVDEHQRFAGYGREPRTA